MIASVLNNRYPKYSQTFKEYRSGFCVCSNYGSAISIIWGYDIGFLGYQLNPNQYAWCLIIGIFCNILATSLNEGAAFYDKWRQTVDEAENLKKENLQSQLEGLKDQVNPHFLFNSLNSLSSLINEDPQKAEKFLDEMSKVYRYLLRTNEDGLTTLDSEMQFIQSYFHMLKTRYGEGINMQLDDHYLSYHIPPLTLQCCRKMQ
jgi:hypothetical protein